MTRLERGPAVPGGFPTGARVTVVSGPHNGQHGLVVDRAPDLRPGSVWVRLSQSGTRLVPGHRLAVH
ncbi:hypothetical protein GCM10023321_14970 [Pseudonocardia eucalypti]|uniref:KOW domain-containing protein n=1 Tax=Pseudonocardia eucalypti TaxID=648755 RepID=A0ABP9PQV1_9PSEU|nr:hypothetical protein [Pseudonocardia eucalypti]